MRTVIVIVAFFLIGASLAAPANDDGYRDRADLRLTLAYQGSAEGAISRVLGLFGATGRCEAWYEVTAVTAKPSGHGVTAGDRLRLQYPCNRDREFRPPEAGTLDWARVDARTREIEVWLRRGDLQRDRHGTWALPNTGSRFRPVGVGEPGS